MMTDYLNQPAGETQMTATRNQTQQAAYMQGARDAYDRKPMSRGWVQSLVPGTSSAYKAGYKAAKN